jgi:putative phosphoesterase
MIQDKFSFLVISDSHGDTAAMTAVLTWAQNTPGSAFGTTAGCIAEYTSGYTGGAFNAAIFLGDGAGDLAPASARAGFTLPWYTVRGNVDTDPSIPGSRTVEIPENSQAARRLFMSHGNIYRIGEGCQTLADAARAKGAEAALYGHTHIPSCAVLDGIFLLNPGSIGRPRSNAGPSFAVLECPAVGPFAARFFTLASQGGETIVHELERY